VPVVIALDEIEVVIPTREGTAQLVTKVLYGSGLRMMADVRLRDKDIDLSIKQLSVRAGKGDKDEWRCFKLPARFLTVFSP